MTKKVKSKMVRHNYYRLISSVVLALNMSFATGNAQIANSSRFRENLIRHELVYYDLHGSAEPTFRQGFSNQPIVFRSIQTATTESDIDLFGNFGNNILDSFKGRNLYLHLAGIASTALIVTTGVDYQVEHYFNQHPEAGQWTRPILFTGELLPFVAGGSLFAYAKIKNDDETLGASFAVLQASLIEFIYNSALKAVTGRPNPDWRHNSDMDSLSKTFRFGFLRGGIFWGWPSGHTAATMAVVSALTNYYPDNTWLKIAGYGLVAYTIVGVPSVNRGGMHWFSDAVAGALLSYAVGSTVGKYYRKVYSTRTSGLTNKIGYELSPQYNPPGINISFYF